MRAGCQGGLVHARWTLYCKLLQLQVALYGHGDEVDLVMDAGRCETLQRIAVLHPQVVLLRLRM